VKRSSELEECLPEENGSPYMENLPEIISPITRKEQSYKNKEQQQEVSKPQAQMRAVKKATGKAVNGVAREKESES